MNEELSVVLRPMAEDDIGKCMMLSLAEGWNQTEKDWERLISNPQNTCLVAENESGIIGTATAMNYSNEVAWIGMVIVDTEFRGRRISEKLLTHLFNQLILCGSIKLDATPAGQTVYERLGFIMEYIIYRMTTLSVRSFNPEMSGIKPEPIQKEDISEVAELDTLIFGAKRSYLLESIIEDNPDKSWIIKRNGKITAFALGRKGRKYEHIGPVFASDLEEAKVLISHALFNLAGQAVVLDIPSDKSELIEWLIFKGLTIQRNFARMYKQSNPFPGRPENQYLICGPEFG